MFRKIVHKFLQRNSSYQINRYESWWSDVKPGVPDAIFGISEAFAADKNPKKVLLGVGAYRTDLGTPFILPSVQKAQELIEKKNMNHEYLPQGGLTGFNEAAAKLALGEDSSILKNNLNITVQALGGTGALRLGIIFLKEFFPGCKVVYIPNPTWKNHQNICNYTGIEWKEYRYYNPKLIEFDFNGMCEDIKAMPEKSIILFHAVAHNPSGLDPTLCQWQEISKLCLEKKLLVFFDMAYQGFASGNSDQDAQSIRQFLHDGHKILIAQSFSKNMGLYGERIGALTIIASSKEGVRIVNSQIKNIIRALYSNPPLYGARIVHHILTENNLKCQWLKDIKVMADRIKSVRQLLVDSLAKVGSQKCWDHINRQIGMFSYTGLTKEQVEKLAKEHSVYLTADGRISVASLGSKNVDYVAKAIHEVTL